MKRQLACAVVAAVVAVTTYVAAPIGGPVAATPVASASAGCLTLGGGCVTVLGSLATVRPNDGSVGTTGADLTAARNEFESFQIVVRAGSSAIPGLTVRLKEPTAGASLTGPGGVTVGSDNVTIYREQNVNITRPSDLEGSTGGYRDPLIPTKDPYYGETRNAFSHSVGAGFTLNVPAGADAVVWVDVLAPWKKPGGGEYPAGAYHGAITVGSSSGASVDVPIDLSVRSLVMPSSPTLPDTFDMNINTPCQVMGCSGGTGKWQMRSFFMRAALENRLSIASPGDAPDTAFHRPYFRQYVLPLIDGTSSQVRLPGAKNGPIFLYAWCASDPDCLTAWRDESRASGFENQIVLYCADEPYKSTANWDACKTAITKLRAVWPTRIDGKTIPVATTATIQHANAPYGGQYNGAPIRDSIDIFIPIVQFLHGRAGGPWQGDRDAFVGDQRSAYDTWASAPGKSVWMYAACDSYYCNDPVDPHYEIDNDVYFQGWPGFAVDEPAQEQRTSGWLASKYRTSGEYYFETVKNLSTAWTNLYNEGGNGDGTLFFPGFPAGNATTPAIGGTHAIPIESMRLKRIRDGREDYELLALLKAHGGADATFAAARVNTLFGVTATTDNAMWTVPTAAAMEQARLDLFARLDTDADPVIAFTRGSAPNREVWVMDADGAHPHKVTNGYQPSWSPDGKRLVFVRGEGLAADLYVVTLASGVEVRLTNSASISDSKPAWAPFGNRIAFVRSGADGKGEIYVMPAIAGAAGFNLTANAAANDFDPSWSIGGSRIVFASVRAANPFPSTSDIWQMDAQTGGDLEDLIDADGDDDLPAWESDTEAVLAYDSSRTGNYDLYWDSQDITNTPAVQEYGPTWGPRGEFMAYTVGVGTGADIYGRNSFGPLVATNLTNSPGVADTDADWWIRRTQPSNRPPVANAGPDRSVASGAAVALDATGSSDPDGDALRFQWAQVGGPATTLTNRTSGQPTAAGVTGPATLTFEVTVTDANDEATTDRVVVHVAAPVHTVSPYAKVVTEGTLRSGTAADLQDDDSRYLKVDSTTASPRVAAWYGRFSAIPNTASVLKVGYKGKVSRTVSLTISVLNWDTKAWVDLATRSVGTTEVTFANLTPAGSPSAFVSGTSGTGEVWVRVRGTLPNAKFTVSGNVLRVAYS